MTKRMRKEGASGGTGGSVGRRRGAPFFTQRRTAGITCREGAFSEGAP